MCGGVSRLRSRSAYGEEFASGAAVLLLELTVDFYVQFAVCSLSVAGLELGSSGVVFSFTYTDEVRVCMCIDAWQPVTVWLSQITMELTHVVEQEVIEFSAKDNDTYTMNKLQQKVSSNITWEIER